jgi:hypothetical protein
VVQLLTNETFLHYAMSHYDNVRIKSIDEFNSDLNIITHFRRASSRFVAGEEINFHLLLNHIITLFNVFGQAAVTMIYFKSDSSIYPVIKTYLEFLNLSPDYIPEINLYTTDIHIIPQIMEYLKTL